MSELRGNVKKAGGDFAVTKNTLLRLAVKNSQFSILNSQFDFTGPTATLFAFADDPAPIKAFVDFARQNELPKIKFGIWNGEPISVDRIKQLANLPGIKELHTQLATKLQSPLAGLVFGLNWNLQKLVIILKGVKN